MAAERYEEAHYVLIETLAPDITIRQYVPQLVADVTVTGSRGQAAGKGFRQLFDYISGGNRPPAVSTPTNIPMTTPVVEKPATAKTTQTTKTTIAMTTPVTEKPAAETPNAWVIRFFLPRNYTLQTIPQPTNANIQISQTEPVMMAVIRFSGVGDDAALRQHEAQLTARLQAAGKTIVGPAEYAFYNAPFTLPFLRRNEVMIPIAG